MYEIIKSVIESQKYLLADLSYKIDTIWIQGDITDNQREELKNFAAAKAPIKEDSDILYERLVKRIDLIEEKIKKLENGGIQPESPTDEYPIWIPYDGVNAERYMIGSKVTHKEERYESAVDRNIWEPGAPGIDNRIWKKVTS